MAKNAGVLSRLIYRLADLKSPIKPTPSPESLCCSSTDHCIMNVVFRFFAVLFLLSMEEADAFIFQQRVPRSSVIERHLQREENETDPTANDFLAEVTAAMLKGDPETEDFSQVATFVEALQWIAFLLELIEHGGRSGEEATFEDVGSNFTPSPELSSMSNETDASVALDQVTDSASGGLEGAIGGDAMADGQSLAVTELPCGVVVSIIAVTAFTLLLEMMD
ncbi:hypothetical protein GQ600_5675 [Phytophthora cactorum]|nr:hypothetical protein GQ600_5675 [Phytophthora cactorum]